MDNISLWAVTFFYDGLYFPAAEACGGYENQAF